MEIEHRFYLLISQLFVHRASLSPEKYSEVYSDSIELVRNRKVSPTIVVQSFTSVFAQVPSSYYLTILHLMHHIYAVSRQIGDYLYPEFFWIITQNDFLAKTDNLANIISLMSSFCDNQVLRGYLSFLMMMQESRRYKDIVFSFISIGHTMATLKLVLEIIPINDENLELYIYTYRDAAAFLHNPQGRNLTLEDNIWLQEFFTRGLLLENEPITESCQAALKKLAE